jgi:hypothetical protein
MVSRLPKIVAMAFVATAFMPSCAGINPGATRLR